MDTESDIMYLLRSDSVMTIALLPNDGVQHFNTRAL